RRGSQSEEITGGRGASPAAPATASPARRRRVFLCVHSGGDDEHRAKTQRSFGKHGRTSLSLGRSFLYTTLGGRFARPWAKNRRLDRRRYQKTLPRPAVLL